MTPEEAEREAWIARRVAYMRRLFPFGFWPDLFFTLTLIALGWRWWSAMLVAFFTSTVLHNVVYEIRFPKEPPP